MRAYVEDHLPKMTMLAAVVFAFSAGLPYRFI